MFTQDFEGITKQIFHLFLYTAVFLFSSVSQSYKLCLSEEDFVYVYVKCQREQLNEWHY